MFYVESLGVVKDKFVVETKIKVDKQTCDSYLFSFKPEIFPVTPDCFKFLPTNCNDFSMFDIQLPFN